MQYNSNEWLMTKIIFSSLWLMLPAIVANSTPVVLAHFRLFESFKKPVDVWLFGENKTWRGIVFGTVFGMGISLLQWYVSAKTETLNLFPYRAMGLEASLTLGFLLSSGILLGDLLKSFFKRLVKKKPGEPWIPFDEFDFLGAYLLMLLIYIPPSPHRWIILIGAPLLHALSNLLGYFLKIKKVWY